MPAKAPFSATSAGALETAAAPTRPRLSGGAIGEAGSRDALANLNAAMAELKAIAIQPLLARAVSALQANDWKGGEKWAQKALEKDERSGFGWYLMGIARERVGDFASSIQCYEAALALIPEHAEVANDLGRLAYRLNMKPQAEKLFRHFLAAHPDNPEAVNNLVCAIRDQLRFSEAIETLRPAIIANPENVQLWNTMGTVVSEDGDFATAQTFFDEALRLDPSFFKGRYNRGNTHVALGNFEQALTDCEDALEQVVEDEERQMMLLSRSTILLNLGRLGEGWDTYEARLSPHFADCTNFLFDRPHWEPGADIAGKSMLVAGEQGLGDEILFSNVLPDIVERLGPDGRLTIVVEPRLVPIYQRSYPQARVVAHATFLIGGSKTIRYAPLLGPEELAEIDLWAPMASLLREYRRTLDSFPNRRGIIKADPERVAHWRKVLEEQTPAGPKVGLLWKSALTINARHRFFSPFEQWKAVLKVKGAVFVNLQYGDCAEELAMAERDLGVRIWTPPGVDLKQDLDEVAAITAAMDLVIGFSNATLNIAAALGAPTWLISAPGAWTRLGTARYPWYPQVRSFMPASYGAWDPVMETVGDALEAFVAEH